MKLNEIYLPLPHKLSPNAMETNQLKLLMELAKKISAEKKDRAAIVASLQSAKILTKKENFTPHLKGLEKVFVFAE